MQSWSLQRKIQVTQTRIAEWYHHYEGQAYVSFSGGKDSTVLADLTARICSCNNEALTLWFSDTGLEYPEIRQHIKDFAKWLESQYKIKVDLVIDYPKDRCGNRVTFKNVIENYGYPVISKNISQYIFEARHTKSEKLRNLRINGVGSKTGVGVISKKYLYMLDAPFEISHKCCEVMKKRPAHKFDKKSGKHPIIGTMSSESKQRERGWLKNGCNAFDKTNPSSQPMSFWTEQDVLKYLKEFKIPYASIYGEIIEDEKGILKTTGCSRTGCVFCCYGCHFDEEPNRFQRLKSTHPKLWEYCLRDWNDGGLGMKDVLNYIGVKY